jgi:hypothetical protein
MLLGRLLLPRLQRHLVVHQQVRQHDLDLGAGEEAAGTGPDSVAEIDVVDAGGGVLVPELVAGDLAQAREAEWVESSRVGVEFGVEVDGVAEDGQAHALWEDVAGGELQAVGIGNDARDVDWRGSLVHQLESWKHCNLESIRIERQLTE